MGNIYHILFVVLLVGLAAGACTVDTNLPPAPVYPTSQLSGALTPTPTTANPLTQSHWSEISKIGNYRPPTRTLSTNPAQVDCPHTQPNLKNWHDAATWGGSGVPGNNQNVNIPAGVSVLISSCSIDPSFVFKVITIPKTSALIFGDGNINISAVGFKVDGALYAGSPTCRLRNKITITLYGKRGDQALPADPWIKGMGVTGSIDLHGVQYTPTWSRLAMTARSGDKYLFIQDLVNWQPGQRIAITTSELKDSRDWHRNEERTIVSVKTTTLGAQVCAIELDSPLAYNHFGGREYQVEVALLSRNIVVQGDATNSDPTDNSPVACNDPQGGSTFPCEKSFLTGFGAHIFINSVGAQGRFSGVEMYRVGQTNVLGRYPIHFHLLGNISASNFQQAFVQDCSVHHSYFRCYAIHGTSGVKLTENTAYDAIGHCYFLEDGIEENNTITYNQGAHVHALGPYQVASQNDGQWYAQNLPDYWQTNDLILPSDMAAGVFYITNTYNDIIGNAASGGWAGFAIPSLQIPVKLFRNVTNISPANRPFRTPFRGNSAHSSGHWWATAGGIYVGGELSQPGGWNAPLKYNTGRSRTRDTCLDTAAGTPTPGVQAGCYDRSQQLWLRFEDNKVFLANRGLQHWGERSEIIRFELHDVSLSMNVFGNVWIDGMLMECRSSNNRPTYLNGCPAAPAEGQPIGWGVCNNRDFNFWQSFGGFQWYDVGQKHILTNSIFRNCREDWNRCIYGSGKNCSGVAVFTSLTHSDEFVPELMQLTAGIQYQNVTALWQYSTSLSDATGITVSGRDQNWYDIDGTASQLNVRAQIGSARAGDWWKYNSQCILYREAWKCPMATGDSAASFIMKYDPVEDTANDNGAQCVNGNWDGTKPCPIVGAISHFGTSDETKMYQIGANAKVSGPIIFSKGGWFIRFKKGTPAWLKLNSVQVDSADALILALPYPSGTTFEIWHEAAYWCGPGWATCRHDYRSVGSIGEVANSFGDAYYWNNTARTLYLRVVSAPETFPKPDTAIWSRFSNPEHFTRVGLTINIPNQFVIINIKASCGGGNYGSYCTAQNDVPVPAAISLPVPPTSTITLGIQTTVAASGAATTISGSSTASGSGTTKSATSSSAGTTKSATTSAASGTTKSATTSSAGTTKTSTSSAGTTKTSTSSAVTTKSATTNAATTKTSSSPSGTSSPSSSTGETPADSTTTGPPDQIDNSAGSLFGSLFVSLFALLAAALLA